MATSSSPALFLSEAAAGGGGGFGTTPTSTTRVIVHPLVLFHILDHHNRRNDAGSRVIGTLLGRKTAQSSSENAATESAVATDKATNTATRVVEITNAFSVPHAERGEEVAIGKDFNKTMLQLHQRAHRKDVVVGWYGTTPSSSSDGGDEEAATSLIQDTSSLIHEFYATETDDGDPIHLVVDTRLLQDSLPIRAYKSSPLVLQGEVLGHLFHELELSLQGSEPEAIVLRSMMESSNAEDATDNKKEALQVSLEQLYELVTAASEYVDKVVDGTISANPVVGRQIADAMAVVPSADSDAMDRLFHESLQDLLMVTYLSNITKTQITIAERLNAALG